MRIYGVAEPSARARIFASVIRASCAKHGISIIFTLLLWTVSSLSLFFVSRRMHLLESPKVPHSAYILPAGCEPRVVFGRVLWVRGKQSVFFLTTLPGFFFFTTRTKVHERQGRFNAPANGVGQRDFNVGTYSACYGTDHRQLRLHKSRLNINITHKTEDHISDFLANGHSIFI